MGCCTCRHPGVERTSRTTSWCSSRPSMTHSSSWASIAKNVVVQQKAAAAASSANGSNNSSTSNSNQTNDILEGLCSGESTAGKKLLMLFILFYGQRFDIRRIRASRHIRVYCHGMRCMMRPLGCWRRNISWLCMIRWEIVFDLLKWCDKVQMELDEDVPIAINPTAVHRWWVV